MAHPFEVGKTYRNRKGAYEVLSLDGPKMVIRYTDGSLLRTTVEIQGRIWRNIQMEAHVEREKQRVASQSPLRRRGGRRGFDFQGLEDHDFQEGVAGTSWRARTGLGGRLAQHMTDSTPHFFQAYPVPRRPEVHIARPEHYGSKIKWRKAKYVFALNVECAWYGFYIEKNAGTMDESWNWLNMIEALSSSRLCEKIASTMREHDLRWKLYVWGDGSLAGEARVADGGLHWEREGHDGPDALSWPDFVAWLRGLDVDTWYDLLLLTSLPKEQAISAGAGIVTPVAAAYRALLPLYEACTRHRALSAPD